MLTPAILGTKLAEAATARAAAKGAEEEVGGMNNQDSPTGAKDSVRKMESRDKTIFSPARSRQDLEK